MDIGNVSPSALFPTEVIEMTGFDSSDGYRIAPMDSEAARIGDEERHENHTEGYEIDPILSSSNLHYSEEDPAIIEEPKGTPAEMATFDPRVQRSRVR